MPLEQSKVEVTNLSLFLNLIEKDKEAYQNYSAFTFRYILTTRIKAACETIATDDRVRWIRQFETYWNRCLDKELRLV